MQKGIDKASFVLYNKRDGEICPFVAAGLAKKRARLFGGMPLWRITDGRKKCNLISEDNMASLQLNHIYKVYPNGVKAVNDFCMDIEDKEFIVFVGPSGCGKSTTLRMIAGLEEITAGELRIGDVVVNDMEPKDRDIAMVFQNYALYPHMTVYDNMAFGLKLRKVPKDEIDKKVREAAEILGITDYLDRKPKAMSGGQRQRVALGRAIVREPKVFLLDEPLSNLDAKLRTAMRSEISKLHHKLQTTFIYVTHDQVEAMTMGTRIVVMKDGFIQQIDTPRNLYRFPCNKFVAGFIGTPQMNFYNGTLKLHGDKVLVSFDNTGIEIDTPYSFYTKADRKYLDGVKPVILGIRAEHISVDPEHYPFKAKCRVFHIEELGTECQIYADLNLNSEDTVAESPTRIIIKALAGTEYEIGQVIDISIGMEHLRVFDAETEHTIAPRIPEQIIVDGEIKGSTLNMLNATIALPAAIAADSGKYQIVIPTAAVTIGGNIPATVITEEKINGQRLVHLRVADRVLFTLADKDAELAAGQAVTIGIDLKQIAIETALNDVVVAPLALENSLGGKLVKEKITVEKEVNGKVKSVKDLKFHLDIAGHSFDCPETLAARIINGGGNGIFNSPLDIRFNPYQVHIADDGIDAIVKDVVDYDNETFAVCTVCDEVPVANPEKGAPKTEMVERVVNVAVEKGFDKTSVKLAPEIDSVAVIEIARSIRLA